MIYINFILIDIMINKEVHLRDIILPFLNIGRMIKKRKNSRKKEESGTCLRENAYICKFNHMNRR